MIAAAHPELERQVAGLACEVEHMSESAITSGAMIGIFAVGLFTLSMGSCDVPEMDARRILESNGVSEIKLDGYAWFGCSRGDIFSREFRGIKAGKSVAGDVCQASDGSMVVRYR